MYHCLREEVVDKRTALANQASRHGVATQHAPDFCVGFREGTRPPDECSKKANASGAPKFQISLRSTNTPPACVPFRVEPTPNAISLLAPPASCDLLIKLRQPTTFVLKTPEDVFPLHAPATTAAVTLLCSYQTMGFARRDWFSASAIMEEREAKAKGKRKASSAAAAAGGAGGASGGKGKGKASGKLVQRGGGSGGSASASGASLPSAISSGCLGAAKTVALIPIKAGSAAATQVRKKHGRRGGGYAADTLAVRADHHAMRDGKERRERDGTRCGHAPHPNAAIVIATAMAAAAATVAFFGVARRLCVVPRVRELLGFPTVAIERLVESPKCEVVPPFFSSE